jgi:hypothetical protein
MVALFFGLAICRLARMSDDSEARALAEWLAMSPDEAAGRLPNDDEDAAYRATG